MIAFLAADHVQCSNAGYTDNHTQVFYNLGIGVPVWPHPAAAAKCWCCAGILGVGRRGNEEVYHGAHGISQYYLLMTPQHYEGFGFQFCIDQTACFDPKQDSEDSQTDTTNLGELILNHIYIHK